jgi:hypothetical protein
MYQAHGFISSVEHYPLIVGTSSSVPQVLTINIEVLNRGVRPQSAAVPQSSRPGATRLDIAVVAALVTSAPHKLE